LKQAMEIAQVADSLISSVKQSQYQRNKVHRSDDTAMELDSIKTASCGTKSDNNNKQFKKKLSLDSQEYTRRKREGLCLACGKTGHRIAACPNFQ